MQDISASGPIELRVATVAQLFHSLDPYPFREKDLDAEAEAFVVGWARELAPDLPIRIVVHLPTEESTSERAGDIGEAFAHFFAYRAQATARDLAELFRVGRYALAVGVALLLVCFALARGASAYLADSAIAPLVQESFLILGWVANWRPLEIFLYEWWPIARKRRLYRRLAAAQVEIAPY
jgi:hypothetical protein